MVTQISPEVKPGWDDETKGLITGGSLLCTPRPARHGAINVTGSHHAARTNRAGLIASRHEGKHHDSDHKNGDRDQHEWGGQRQTFQA